VVRLVGPLPLFPFLGDLVKQLSEFPLSLHGPLPSRFRLFSHLV
jgi:hypothetical protein